MCFWKVAGENGKKLLPDIYLNYQKQISPMDVLIFMQLSANDFRVRTKGRNKTTLQETLSVRYFNIINTAQR